MLNLNPIKVIGNQICQIQFFYFKANSQGTGKQVHEGAGHVPMQKKIAGSREYNNAVSATIKNKVFFKIGALKWRSTTI